MKALSRQTVQKIMKRKIPDMSHIKSPTELAVKKMIRNLHAADKNKQ